MNKSSLIRNPFVFEDLVDLFPVNDSRDQDTDILHTKHHAVVADAEFPISLQSSSERLAVFLGCR